MIVSHNTYYSQEKMDTITITLSKDHLSGVVKAYHALQDFLATAISPNDLYRDEFLAGLQESDEDIRLMKMNEVCSFGDFVS